MIMQKHRWHTWSVFLVKQFKDVIEFSANFWSVTLFSLSSAGQSQIVSEQEPRALLN